MEVNNADVFNSRDNLYPNDSHLDDAGFGSLPHPFCSDPYFSSEIAFEEFDFFLDTATLPKEIQSVTSNNELLSSFQTELLYVENQHSLAQWDYRPQAVDLYGLSLILQHHVQHSGLIISSRRWNHLNMSEIIPEYHQSVQVAEPAFPTGNETLNRAIHGPGPNPDQNNHPYVCIRQSCNSKSFSNKSGLERHKREVHSSQQFKCPILSCHRSKRGFHRRYNLSEHQRRVHGSQSSNFPASCSNSEDVFESEGTTSPECEVDAKEENRDMEITDAGSNTREEVMSKLRDLRTIREELNEDIKSMERVLSIMGGGY
ncbi:hypothetical protein V492_01842 [Pseudogymnoascus sp. VKM F-4246]|nr:hypothetical protein V492_01842 [Pseudogymnoascus sp. VKM F-4246]